MKKTEQNVWLSGLILGALIASPAWAGPVLPIRGSVQSTTEANVVVKGKTHLYTLKRKELPPSALKELLNFKSKSVAMKIPLRAIASIKKTTGAGKQKKAGSSR